jgi:hypothetical protein
MVPITGINDTGRLYFVIGFAYGNWAVYNNLYSQIKFQKTKALTEKPIHEKYYSNTT